VDLSFEHHRCVRSITEAEREYLYHLMFERKDLPNDELENDRRRKNNFEPKCNAKKIKLEKLDEEKIQCSSIQNLNPNEKQVCTEQVNRLWSWFGQGLKLLRDQKNTRMWADGKVIGFISRDHSEKLLEKHSPGTFLIRFCEMSPSQLVISWRSHLSTHHSLLPFKDARKSIAELLFTKKQLLPLTQILCVKIPKTNDEYCCFSKDSLSIYCTPKNSPGSPQKPDKEPEIQRDFTANIVINKESSREWVYLPLACWQQLMHHPQFKTILEELHKMTS